jgi:hypothetical protein
MPDERELNRLAKTSITDDIHHHFRSKLQLNRPFDNKNRLARLGLSTDLKQFNAIEYAARSGGYTIDRQDLTPIVTPDDNGIYHYYFGTHEIDEPNINDYLKSAVNIGDKLELKDGNLYHQGTPVGAASGYVIDLHRSHPEAIDINIDLVTADIYKFHKVLCHVKFDGNISTPFTTEYYQPLATVLAGVN